MTNEKSEKTDDKYFSGVPNFTQPKLHSTLIQSLTSLVCGGKQVSSLQL